MGADVKRIDSYDDKRFSDKILKQHGAFLINGEIPCGVEIIGADTAVIHYNNCEFLDEIISSFRFYAEHISKFYDDKNQLIKEFPPLKTFAVKLKDIQPSQFFVDSDKIKAVKTFIRCPKDIIIPLLRLGEKFISLDGHTRLALAVENGWDEVSGFISESDDVLFGFVKEAQKRKVFTPYDLKTLCHDDYDILWNKFCDGYFAAKNSQD